MMFKLFYPAICLAALTLFCGCASDECRAFHSGDTVTLENGLLSLEIMPKASGVICALEYLPEQRRMIEPVNYIVEKVDLLPDRASASSNGVRALLWGRTGAKVLYESKIVKIGDLPGEAKVVLQDEFFHGELLEAVKSIRLKRGSSAFSIRFEVKNNYDQTQELALWHNSVLQLSPGYGREPLVLPVRGNVKRMRKRGLVVFDSDGVFVENDPMSRNMFFAANRPWAAKFTPGRPGVLAFRSRERDFRELIIYTHKNRELHTLELICPPRKTAPGKWAAWEVDGMYFPRLHGLRDIRGSFGVDLRDGALELESCRPAAATTLRVAGVGNFRLPASKPGRLHRIRLPEKFPAPLTLTLNGEKFTLPRPVMPRN